MRGGGPGRALAKWILRNKLNLRENREPGRYANKFKLWHVESLSTPAPAHACLALSPISPARAESPLTARGGGATISLPRICTRERAKSRCRRELINPSSLPPTNDSSFRLIRRMTSALHAEAPNCVIQFRSRRTRLRAQSSARVSLPLSHSWSRARDIQFGRRSHPVYRVTRNPLAAPVCDANTRVVCGARTCVVHAGWLDVCARRGKRIYWIVNISRAVKDYCFTGASLGGAVDEFVRSRVYWKINGRRWSFNAAGCLLMSCNKSSVVEYGVVLLSKTWRM